MISMRFGDEKFETLGMIQILKEWHDDKRYWKKKEEEHENIDRFLNFLITPFWPNVSVELNIFNLYEFLHLWFFPFGLFVFRVCSRCIELLPNQHSFPKQKKVY